MSEREGREGGREGGGEGGREGEEKGEGRGKGKGEGGGRREGWRDGRTDGLYVGECLLTGCFSPLQTDRRHGAQKGCSPHHVSEGCLRDGTFHPVTI